MKKSKTIQLDERTVEISKLPLGRYAEMLKMLKELPKHVSGMTDLSNEQMLEQLPNLLAVALPEVTAIIALATPLKQEEIEELGMDEVVDVILAIVEVNKYQQVYQKIKKALARPTLETEKATTGSGGQ